MEYGKAFGVAASSGIAVAGYKLGYGWLILGGLIVTISLVIVIRHLFRRGKSIGDF